VVRKKKRSGSSDLDVSCLRLKERVFVSSGKVERGEGPCSYPLKEKNGGGGEEKK